MTEYLTTRELAELLRIKERKVYDLVSSGNVPFSKATGKLLFPKDAINRWLTEHSVGMTYLVPEPLPKVFLGSHDPLLDWALRESQCGIATYFDGSLDGVERFIRREGMATSLHIYDQNTEHWNTEIVKLHCKYLPAVLVHWAKRVRGLIVSEKLQHSVRSMADIRGLRFAPRQEKAGAQMLFLYLLEKANLKLEMLELLPPERTEVDTALCILEGKADCTFGLEAVADSHRLPFVPLIEEQFDLLVDRHCWFEPDMQIFHTFWRSSHFEQRARQMSGYDISESGQVRFNGP